MTVPDTEVPGRIGLSDMRTDWIAIGSAGFGHRVALALGDAGALAGLAALGPGPAAAMPLAHAIARHAVMNDAVDLPTR